MRDFTAAARPDHHFSSPSLSLTLNAVEERRQTHVIILSPSLERMIVALRTLNSHTHKQLSRSFGAIIGSVGRPVEVGRGHMIGAPFSSQQLSTELIERNVFREGTHDPFVILVHAVGGHLLFTEFQQIAPAQRPEPGVFGTLKDRLNQLGPLVAGRIVQKPLYFVDGGKNPQRSGRLWNDYANPPHAKITSARTDRQ